MNKLISFLFVVVVLFSCKNPAPSPAVVSSGAEAAVIDSFFPVTSFLKGQFRLLDSIEVTPLHITTIKDHQDSVWMDRKDLRSLLSGFLTPEIKETNLKGLFKETKFLDQTLNAFTFSYDPIKQIPDSIPLLQWIVYIHPETERINKIYMIKRYAEKGNKYIQQMTWQTGKSAKIVQILQQPDGKDVVDKTEEFIWKFD